MTNIEQKALELVNEVCREWDVSFATDDDMDGSACFAALCRSIERHEAFRREVSDLAKGFKEGNPHFHAALLDRFIIAKPDLLVEAIHDADEAQKGWASAKDYADQLRTALAKRGGRIVFD